MKVPAVKVEPNETVRWVKHKESSKILAQEIRRRGKLSFFSQSRGKVSFWEFTRMVLPLCLSPFLLFSPTRAVLMAAGGEGEGEG